MLESMRRASGVRQVTCPWQAFRDPFVIAVVNAHRWWKVGELRARWPDPPEALVRGIDVYESALNAVLSHDMRADRKRQEDEDAARLAAMQHGPMPHRPLPPPRRSLPIKR